jgi:hypothetical protein
MLRKVNLLLVSIILSAGSVFAQAGFGSLKGMVSDATSNEPMPFVNVVLYQNGIQKGYAQTDFDGKFEIGSLTPGAYDVEAVTVNYGKYKRTGVIVNSNKITFLNDMKMSNKILTEVEVKYVAPIVNKDGGASGETISRDDIKVMAPRSVSDIAGTVAGVSNTGDGVSVRGARPGDNSTYYYIDGIKVRGSVNMPKSAIEEVAVITGGVPANYGDVTGGVISVTTRGPSANYFGSIEGVASGFYFKGKDQAGYDGKSIGLDKFGYNLLEGMISGPLWMKKDTAGKKTNQPILGFFLSANYTGQLDSRPAKGGTYRIKKEARDYLLENPLRPTGTGLGTYYNSNFLQAGDFEKTAYRMNAKSMNLSASAKIDVNAGKNINLSFGGTMNWGKGSAYDYTNSLMNFTNFGYSNSVDWRVYGKFTQRFLPKKGSKSKLKSASYTIMVDYSRSTSTTEDPTYKDKLFNYGYVGKFTTYRKPTYALNASSDTLVHNGFKDYEVDFSPSQVNPAFAAVTRQYYDIYDGKPIGHYENLFQIQQGNGLRNGDVPDDVYGIWGNLGTPYNYYGKSDAAQFRVTGSGSVNIGDHRITLGFEFEQRTDRGYQTPNGPIGLWTIARQYLNSHILELDVNKPTYDNYNGFHRVTYDRLNAGYGATNGVYGGQENGDQQTFFDYNVRNKMGYNPFGTDYINIDELDPNQLSLDMFSPDELFNSGNNFIQYWGYDYTGKRIKGKTDINNYFNEFDKNGNYKRTIGAFQPLYVSGYIMDKFAFDDIIFNVGVRVDVFDANQPTLKDPFLVYSARNVKDANTLASSNPGQYDWVKIPSSMGDDYTVYVNDVNNPTQIKGFRSGNQWYNASGVPVSDPSLIVGANGISPWLLNPGQKSPSADAFTNYKPQVNVMPRIAFSFPVSDKSNFFAHYDILTKRPTSGFRFDPIDYQFMAVRNVIVNNSNLKPEKTISYEFGFQQEISKKSAVKISAFYNEQRNMVQLMGMYEAYPRTYRTYGNRDFGTVKGISVEYNLRRTGNVQLRVNYTLQFANGTGSSSTTALSLVNTGQPNLQNIFPYSYDQRHKFNVVFDYRFGEGKNYNGPTTKKGGQVLKNMGLNIVANIGSGTPYSRQNMIMGTAFISGSNSGLQGTLNGSRQPWTYSLDLQLDRTFTLKMGKKDDKGERTKTAYLNIYLRVTNILNTGNVLSVYRSTGNPDDDGYLAAAKYQSSIQNQLDEQSFRNYYAMKVNNPFNLSAPRTIRLGVKFDF